MRQAIEGRARVLVIGQVSKTGAFTFVPAHYVCSHKVVVLALDGDADFALLQSRVHDSWARFFSSSFKDDLSYTPTDCFETFPFPSVYEHQESIASAGRTYFEFRADLMRNTREGLTDVYNRFHDPNESNVDVLRLRELHAAMDRVVLDAYGWNDIQPTCEFLLDYEDDDDEEPSGGRRKKKPWRYRWPDDVRDEVLARLLELNALRAKEQAGTPAPAGPGTPSPAGKKPRARGKAKKPTPTGQGGLFGEESE